VLPTALPCGARTFLDARLTTYAAVARPAPPPGQDSDVEGPGTPREADQVVELAIEMCADE